MSNEKELRNKKILDLHNSGKTLGEISKAMGLGKTSVHAILGKMLNIGNIPPKEVVDVKLTGNEERFGSFIGWERLDVNEYSNKVTGDVVRVAYVKAKGEDEFGYFVKLK